MLIISQIEKIAITNKGSKREIANFILQNSREISLYTVDDIAQKTFTSKASVVRFAKNLGFNGWRAFNAEFAKEQDYLSTHQGEIDANFPFKKNDSTDTVINHLQKLMTQSISATNYLVDPKNLEKTVSIICKSKTVALYAVSPNSYLAELFKRKLLSIGISAIVVNDDEAGLETGTLNANDCAIIISYSGTQESLAVRHINILKAQHVPVIAITSDTQNYLREKADFSLSIVTEENLYTKIAPFQTETSTEFILNILFALVFKENYDGNQNYHLDSARYLELSRKNGSLNS